MKTTKTNEGFFSSLGGSIDRSFRESKEDILEGVDLIKSGFKKMCDIEDNDDVQESSETLVVKTLLERIDKIGEPVGDDFTYSTVLRWVKDNHIGDRFYMLKYRNPEKEVTYLFVFFGEDENIRLSAKDPMICFITKHLPDNINDIFNGKNLFIQPFN